MATRGSSSRRRPQRRPAARKRAERARGARARLQAGLKSKRVQSAARALGLTTTRRAAIAALVVCALAFTLAVPLRTYLSQQSDLSEQAAKRTHLQQQVAQLERRQAQLSDPVQVKAEARRRLRYVMPGETPYIVQMPGQQAIGADKAAKDKAATPWYQTLWSTMNSTDKKKPTKAADKKPMTPTDKKHR